MVNAEGTPAALVELEERLVADLRPVRSFHPDRACLLVVALGFGVGVGVLWPLLGLRPDAAVLGPLWLWGPSVLSMATGAVLISLALRRAIPGNLPASSTLYASAGIGLALCAVLYVAVSDRSPVRVPPEEALGIGLRCIAMEVCLGLPALLLLFWLARKGVAADPLPAVIVGSLGVTFVADAAWRLICQYSHPGHVVTSHGPGMLAVVLIGVGLAFFWDRRQLDKRC